MYKNDRDGFRQTIAWLVTSPDASRFANGEMLTGPDFFAIHDITRDFRIDSACKAALACVSLQMVGWRNI